jgi:hypothetical protein
MGGEVAALIMYVHGLPGWKGRLSCTYMRTERFEIRLSKEELAGWKAKAAMEGKELTAWVRSRCSEVLGMALSTLGTGSVMADASASGASESETLDARREPKPKTSQIWPPFEPVNREAKIVNLGRCPSCKRRLTSPKCGYCESATK